MVNVGRLIPLESKTVCRLQHTSEHAIGSPIRRLPTLERMLVINL